MQEAKQRALKVPNPDFLVGRLADGKGAILLSGASHSALVGEKFLLVNEVLKEGQEIKAHARVSFGQDADTVSSVESLGDARSSVDPLQLEEFKGREGPFHVLRLKLLKRFSPPRTLSEGPSGRFSGFVNFTEAVDLPKTEDGRTTVDVFAMMAEMGRKFSKEEAEYVIPAPSPDKVCGACRFYLRNPDGSEMGRCQVVDGEIAWFGTSKLYIGAADEARAAFEIAEEMPGDPQQEAAHGLAPNSEGVCPSGYPVKRKMNGAVRCFRSMSEAVEGISESQELDVVRMAEDVLPFGDLPLSDRAMAWDAGEARKRIAAWADGDVSKYSKAFVILQGSRENLTSYKLPVADIVDGELRAVPRAAFAAAAVLQGSRGGIDATDEDKAGARTHIGKYYEKMELKAPWDRE